MLIKPGDEVIVLPAGSCRVAQDRLTDKTGKLKCYDWFFFTNKLSKEDEESNLGK